MADSQFARVFNGNRFDAHRPPPEPGRPAVIATAPVGGAGGPRRIALVHEWFDAYYGSERVVEQVLRCFPQADVFALIDVLPEDQRGFLRGKQVTTSFLQRVPMIRRRFRRFLPLMPLAIEQFDLSGYELVISSSHAVAKGVLTGPDQLHVSYVHAPMRYAWEYQHQYLRQSGLDRGLKTVFARYLLHRLRMWDQRTANGVDRFVANSGFIARRIDKIYRRDSTVIYPPVDVASFPLHRTKSDYYLAVSRFVPYKQTELILEAFAAMPDRRLVVIGNGPGVKKIRDRVPPNVTVLGFQPAEMLRRYLCEAQALVFAAEEDFGIVPVEAQACGTPVIAFSGGGVVETVRGLDADRPTGVFFDRQDPAAIIAAVREFERYGHVITPDACRANAMRFAPERFREQFSRFVAEAWAAHTGGRPAAAPPRGVVVNGAGAYASGG